MSEQVQRVRGISPTSFNTFWSDRDQWYMRYRMHHKDKQTLPMAKGSAFDLLVKAALREALGLARDPTELRDKVDASLLEEASRHGAALFAMYKATGAYVDLLRDLTRASSVRMEFEVRATVRCTCIYGVRDVEIMGYPDLWYLIEGHRSIVDWKVNGIVSPPGGYVKDYAPGRAGRPHKDVMPMMINGIIANSCGPVGFSESELVQQVFYGWLMGERAPVPGAGGSEFMIGIDRLCAGDARGRVARYRCLVGQSVQEEIASRLGEMDYLIATDAIVTPERREVLDAQIAQGDIPWLN